MRSFSAAVLMVAMMLAAGSPGLAAKAGHHRSLLQSTAAPGGACGPSANAKCPSGQCCSQYGWCGVTSAHCGSGCQSAWGYCTGSSGSSSGGSGSSSSDATTAAPGGACGPSANAKCPSGQCCSQYGWCGVTSAHCGSGCQSAWGYCSGSGSTGNTGSTGSAGGSSSTGSTGSGTVLYSGSNVGGTYYFDLYDKCPSEPNGYPETDGYPTCASYTPGPYQQTLRQVGSNNVVAIDANLLGANRAKYCGKKVLVYKNGVQVRAPDGGDFFVWDGCAACIGGGKIDFSVSGLKNVDPNACNLGVVPGVSFQVVDQQVKAFVA